MDYVTWKDFHPELAKIFDTTWDYKKIAWPCEVIDTSVGPVYQPCMAMGPEQNLFVAGHMGQVFHSSDLGKSWALLCTSPVFAPELPKGMKMAQCESCGIGVTSRNTILLTWETSYNDGHSDHSYRDETFHRLMWTTRSEDRGKTWEPITPFDPSPYQTSADQVTIVQLRDGRLMVPIRVQAWSRPGKPVSVNDNIFRSFIYTSSDDGKTWSKLSSFTDHSVEPDLLELPSGKILSYVRYQRNKLPGDPPELATPHDTSDWPKGCTSPADVGQTLFQNSAFTSSDDGGMTWATPRLITGTSQQSGSLVRLSDGTLVFTFGRWGQRFMLSYDEGKTWSKAVYQLNLTGEYARSVVLEDNMIVTVHDGVHFVDGKGVRPRRLTVLRWKVPAREEVEQHGFFTPREVETGLK